MKIRCGIKVERPRAFTLLEVCVAAALIASLLVTTLKMLHALNDYRTTSRRRAYSQQAVAAVSEQVGNIPWDQLATETAGKIAIPVDLRAYLLRAKLSVDVAEETDPAAKRISVEITWPEQRGRTVEPIRLTTWAFPQNSSNP